MAGVWHGSPPIVGSPDAPLQHFADPRPRRRNEWAIKTALIVAVVVAYSYVGLQLWDIVSPSLGNFGNFGKIGFDLDVGALERGQASANSAGAAANAAANVTATQLPGSLSVTALNAALAKYQWVNGVTNVPFSSPGRPIVGVNANETDIETAVQGIRGSCSFGLIITSSTDPLIAEDGLPGPGTYDQFVYRTSRCIADQAPTSGWQSWLGTP